MTSAAAHFNCQALRDRLQREREEIHRLEWAVRLLDPGPEVDALRAKAARLRQRITVGIAATPIDRPTFQPPAPPAIAH